MLQDGTELTLRPLAIKPLRKVMKAWDDKMDPDNQPEEGAAEDEETFLDFLCGISFQCLQSLKATRGVFKTQDDFEDEVDSESIYRIIKVCLGIDLEALPKAMREAQTAAEESGVK